MNNDNEGCFDVVKGLLALFALVMMFVFSSSDDNKNTEQSAQHEVWPPTVLSNQNTDGIPRVMMIVFDASGSMSYGDKLPQAKTAVSEYIKAVPGDVKIGAIVFVNDNVSTVAEIGSRREEIVDEITKIGANGGTPLAEAFGRARDELTEWVRKNGTSECHLVIITDGEADSVPKLSAEVESAMAETPIRIFAIGLKGQSEHSLKRPGVRFVTAEDKAGIKSGLGRVLAEKEEF